MARRSDESSIAVVDVYGFKLQLTSQQQAERMQCAEVQQRQALAWQRSVGGKEDRLPEGSKLKKLVRGGIPPHHRAWVWTRVSGAAALRAAQTGSYYANLVAAGHLSESTRQIELDLPRTFPAHPWMQSAEGQSALGNVLVAFSLRSASTVGYCQGLNFVAALLLLVAGRDETAAFWLLVALVEKILYPGTYSHNLSGAHVEMRTLDGLLAAKLPRLATHLEGAAGGAGAFLWATDWFLCLFATSLPSEAVARVWDALFMEGPKVLFRVALAILRLLEPVLMTQDNAGEVLECIKHGVTALHQRDRLMAVAFDKVGGLPMDTIDKMRNQHLVAVQAMLGERERERRLRDLRDAAAAVQREQDRLRDKAAEEDRAVAARLDPPPADLEASSRGPPGKGDTAAAAGR